LSRADLGDNAIGLGTAALAVPYGPPGAEAAPPSRTEAVRVIQAALDLGVATVDTAPAYGDAESLVGEAIRGRACRVTTKVATPEGGWAGLRVGEIEHNVVASARASLARLDRDVIDVLQLHNATADLVAGEAVPAALAAVRDSGLARAIGATVYDEHDAVAVIRHPVFDLVQLPYNALDRRPEARVLPLAERERVDVVARSLLLRGVLSKSGATLEGRFSPLRIAADAVRRAFGVEWDELPGAAVAWVVAQPRVRIALIGPRDEHELRRLVEGARRFEDRVCELGLQRETLPDELLDPRRWGAA
jgi:aryl-alcohol dehydrogenase-like predicted oxidoreductase